MEDLADKKDTNIITFTNIPIAGTEDGINTFEVKIEPGLETEILSSRDLDAEIRATSIKIEQCVSEIECSQTDLREPETIPENVTFFTPAFAETEDNGIQEEPSSGNIPEDPLLSTQNEQTWESGSESSASSELLLPRNPDIIKQFVAICDRLVLPRARAVLPTQLVWKKEQVYPTPRYLPEKICFGPVEGIFRNVSYNESNRLVQEASMKNEPVFLITNEDGSIVHIDTSDQDKTNWFSLLKLGTVYSDSMLWLYQSGDHLYGLTVTNPSRLRPLKLGYSLEYAERYGIPSSQPILDLDKALAEMCCPRCNTVLSSMFHLKKHEKKCQSIINSMNNKHQDTEDNMDMKPKRNSPAKYKKSQFAGKHRRCQYCSKALQGKPNVLRVHEYYCAQLANRNTMFATPMAVSQKSTSNIVPTFTDEYLLVDDKDTHRIQDVNPQASSSFFVDVSQRFEPVGDGDSRKRSLIPQDHHSKNSNDVEFVNTKPPMLLPVKRRKKGTHLFATKHRQHCCRFCARVIGGKLTRFKIHEYYCAKNLNRLNEYEALYKRPRGRPRKYDPEEEPETEQNTAHSIPDLSLVKEEPAREVDISIEPAGGEAIGTYVSNLMRDVNQTLDNGDSGMKQNSNGDVLSLQCNETFSDSSSEILKNLLSTPRSSMSEVTVITSLSESSKTCSPLPPKEPKDPNQKIKVKPVKNVDYTFYCPHCNKGCHNKHVYNNSHKWACQVLRETYRKAPRTSHRQSKPKSFSCKKCHIHYPSEAELEIHIRKRHFGCSITPAKYWCPVCPQTFEDLSQRNDHITTDKCLKPYVELTEKMGDKLEIWQFLLLELVKGNRCLYWSGPDGMFTITNKKNLTKKFCDVTGAQLYECNLNNLMYKYYVKNILTSVSGRKSNTYRFHWDRLYEEFDYLERKAERAQIKAKKMKIMYPPAKASQDGSQAALKLPTSSSVSSEMKPQSLKCGLCPRRCNSTYGLVLHVNKHWNQFKEEQKKAQRTLDYAQNIAQVERPEDVGSIQYIRNEDDIVPTGNFVVPHNFVQPPMVIFPRADTVVSSYFVDAGNMTAILHQDPLTMSKLTTKPALPKMEEKSLKCSFCPRICSSTHGLVLHINKHWRQMKEEKRKLLQREEHLEIIAEVERPEDVGSIQYESLQYKDAANISTADDKLLDNVVTHPEPATPGAEPFKMELQDIQLISDSE